MSSKKKSGKKPNTDKDKSASKDKKTKKAPLKISKKKEEECKGDLKCLAQIEDMTLEDVYGSKSDVFGNMLIIPELAPKQDFTPRCRGTKRYKVYEKVNDKGKTGIKLKSLSKSLLKPLEKDTSCFLEKKIPQGRKELGKTCKKDEDCLSDRCSSIKLFGMKGKCILPESPKSIGEGSKCEYENDCKKGLTCKDKICVVKQDKLTEAKEKKEKKRSMKGLFDDFVGDYGPKTKKKKKKYLSDFDISSNDTCISQDKLSEFVENKKDYVTINKYTKCDPKFCGHDCDKGDYCYKNSCTSINPKCEFSKKCLTDSFYEHETCCNKEHYCKTVEDDGEYVSFCEPLNLVTNLQNGFYCVENKNCKSSNCNKKINKCMSKKKKNLTCSTDEDCQKNIIYGNKNSGCVNEKCYDKNNFPKKSRKILETCDDDKHCKTKRCGRSRLPASVMQASDNYIKTCLPEKGNQKQLKEYLEKVNEKLKVDRKYRTSFKLNNIVEQINNLEKYKYIFFLNRLEPENNINNLVIIRKNKKKYVLGYVIFHGGMRKKLGFLDIKRNNSIMKKGAKGLGKLILFTAALAAAGPMGGGGNQPPLITILYFDEYYSSYKDALNNMKMITNSPGNPLRSYYKLNKLFGKSRILISRLLIRKSHCLILDNKMIFDYICLRIFGERKMVLNTDSYVKEPDKKFQIQISGIDKSILNNNIFEKSSDNVYYQINKELLNFEEHYDEDYSFETSTGDIFTLPIPFNHDRDTGVISGVTAKDVDMQKIKSEILNKKYVNVNYTFLPKILKHGHFDLKLKSDGKVIMNGSNNIELSDKKEFDLKDITNNSIFAECLKKK